jgi:hypothetical protein
MNRPLTATVGCIRLGALLAFALKVTKGPGVGTEFPFENDEAKLGRTADNDLVVKDSSASRSHCRVYAKNGKFFLEDLKSANGTKLNGALVAAAKEIKAGDTITIGDIVFTFSTFTLRNHTEIEAPAATGLDKTDESDLQAIDPNATLLKPNRKPSERRVARRAAPAPVRHDTEGEIGTVPQGRPNVDVSSSTIEVAVPPPKALAKAAPVDDSTREVTRRPAAAKVERRESADDEEVSLTAADKAKKRREQQKSATGRLAMRFQDLPKVARVGIGLLLSAIGLGALGLGGLALIPKNTGPRAVEPGELFANAPGIKESFGLGDDVTWSRPDMKVFNFSLASPTPVVAVLHFGARDISKDEVQVSLNGAAVTTVPPDNMDTTRELEVIFQPNLVKPREANLLEFDSLRNPPGNDPWRVYNIWIEIIPIPDLSEEETGHLAKDSIVKADKLYESRDIGPDNLFKAWKTFREAWLLLESIQNKATVADSYTYARTRMRDLRPMLDQKCNGLMVEFKKAMSGQQTKLAIQRLKEVERYFPTREHPCHGFSKALLSEMEAF